LPLVASLSAAQATRAGATTGYSPASAEAQRRAEQAAIQGPRPARAKSHSAALSKEPHVAGTPAQKRTADYVIAQMKAMGLETELRQYDVWLPHATGVKVTRMGRDTTVLNLAEPAIPGDPVTAMKQYLTVNGSSAAGVGEGELVFANYGLIEDYAVLDSLGVSVKGKVVLARYGGSFRGIKAREAEKRGAVALLIYTDPADDGFARGDVYPEGPMRPMDGVQRGSVFNGAGDPLTPGYASKPGAPRLRVDQTELPKIPVVPISGANAQRLLSGVRGTNIPATWQGGLPLRYHVGPGPTRVKVEVTTDAATNGTKAIYNTLGYLRGSEFPDEYVYIGGHRDGWGAGAADNVSGIVSVLEAAQSLSEMAKRGIRARRTIVFATWDAEEWGLVGSSEYVEDDSLRLQKGAVAYLNQDVAAQGPSFSGGGTPSLRAVLRDIVKSVPDPKGGRCTRRGGPARTRERTRWNRRWVIRAAAVISRDSTITSASQSPSGDLADRPARITRRMTRISGWSVSAIRDLRITPRRRASARRRRCESPTRTSFHTTTSSFANTMRRYLRRSLVVLPRRDGTPVRSRRCPRASLVWSNRRRRLRRLATRR
jgi:N-acetylated-alpha-linked acidic dipeptidase